MAHESGVTTTVDPLAGSYFVESLTDKIEEQVWDYLNKIEEMGGMVHAIENGYIQKEIQDAAFRYQREIEEVERIQVGVNKFTVEDETPQEILKVNPTLREVQIKKIAQVHKARDNDAVRNKLAELKIAAADPKQNLMPLIVDAARAYASLGEISNVLRDVFGEYEETVVL